MRKPNSLVMNDIQFEFFANKTVLYNIYIEGLRKIFSKK